MSLIACSDFGVRNVYLPDSFSDGVLWIDGDGRTTVSNTVLYNVHVCAKLELLLKGLLSSPSSH